MAIDYGQAQFALAQMVAAQQRMELEVQKQIFESSMNESTNTINGEYSVVDVKRIDNGA